MTIFRFYNARPQYVIDTFEWLDNDVGRHNYSMFRNLFHLNERRGWDVDNFIIECHQNNKPNGKFVFCFYLDIKEPYDAMFKLGMDLNVCQSL